LVTDNEGWFDIALSLRLWFFKRFEENWYYLCLHSCRISLYMKAGLFIVDWIDLLWSVSISPFSVWTQNKHFTIR